MIQPAAEFEALYRRHAAEVARFAFVLSGDRGEADEITQETFVRAWASAEPIRTETIKGYLFTIARNVFRQSRRKRARETPLDEASAALHDSRADPAELTERSTELGAVVRRLQTLPESDRAALLMHVFDGLSYAEVARVLGLSLANVKIRIHRARLALTKAREGE